jgi:hypothetical protein
MEGVTAKRLAIKKERKKNSQKHFTINYLKIFQQVIWRILKDLKILFL